MTFPGCEVDTRSNAVVSKSDSKNLVKPTMKTNLSIKCTHQGHSTSGILGHWKADKALHDAAYWFQL